MAVTSSYPVITSDDVAATAAFYRDVIGFEEVYSSDWYVSLRHGVFELAVLAHDHETIPAAYRALPRGVIVNLEVDDVDAVHDVLRARSDVEIVREIRDEDFGQRHFIVAAPNGVLLDVIQPIEPTAEFAAAYLTV